MGNEEKISVGIDPKIREQVEAVLMGYELTLEEAVISFLKETAKREKIPFELKPTQKNVYKNVIQIKQDISADTLYRLEEMANVAFDNRAGKVVNTSSTPYQLVFEGDDDLRGCLDLGMLKLKRETVFLDCVSSWQWVDDDSDECCDLLKLIAKKG